MIPKKATYGNPENTYSYTYSPVHYDYIFHRANNGNMMWTSFFDVRTILIFFYILLLLKFLQIPLFKTKKDANHEVSFSDHEAVTAKLFLKKPAPVN